MNNANDTHGYTIYPKPATTGAYTPFIYSLVLAFGVVLGFVVNSITTGKESLLGKQYNKLEDIFNYIELKYVDTVERTALTEKTIEKLFSSLDPHTVYIPADETADVNESLEGNFEGIGIEFSVVQDTITVVTVIPGGPSEIIGLKAGDRIVKINDSTVAGIKIKDNEVKKRLRGPKGTIVKVSVLRSGRNQLLVFDIKRDKIPLYSVDAAYMLNAETGYIKISNFSSTTHREFAEKVDMLNNQGMKKLIIDLRDNPGGYLQAATQIADELLAGEKLIVFTKGKAYPRQDYKASKPGLFEKGELRILVNQNSASASEILAGAVQDWDRGIIIGRTSFGKGLVQEQYELRDGSMIRLTVARYYTPSGRCIQRSYSNGVDDYNNEVYQRYLRGDFIHEDTTHTTDTTVYKTAKGRKVYGGGGIRPDVFVPADTSSELDYILQLRAFVPEFVYKYTSGNSGFMDSYKDMRQFSEQFAVSALLLNEFYSYAVKAGLKRDITKDIKSETKLKQYLKAFLAKQQWRLEGYYYIMNQTDEVVNVAEKQ
ncbi:MAG: S41 family peptidase [Chitinophagales bacterium]|nr:S41 family peptidase [Chitinophagales bacterium]